MSLEKYFKVKKMEVYMLFFKSKNKEEIEIIEELKSLRLNISELPSKHPSQVTTFSFSSERLNDQIPIICDTIRSAINALKTGRDIYKNRISKEDISFGINKLLNNSIRKSGWELLMESVLNEKGSKLLRDYLNQLGDIAKPINN